MDRRPRVEGATRIASLLAVPVYRHAVTVALLAICAALYVPPAVSTPFFTKGEPREALVVRDMVERGAWLLPRRPSVEGWTIASKPPFFHWLGALVSEAAGGTSEWTVRAPSVALGTAAVLAVWLVGRRMLGPAAALAAALVLATTHEWVRAVSSARVDAVLAALMTGGLLLFYRGVVRGGLGRVEAVAAYACLAAATLTKGPVGCVLPALVLVVALVVQGQLVRLPRFRPLLGMLVVGVLAGGWYAIATELGGDAFVEKQMLKENVFRFLGTTRLRSGHDNPFYYHLPTFAAGFLPWTPFLLAALVALVRDRDARYDPRLVFPLVWFVTVFVFYSIASAKRSVYLLGLYPAAALLTGWWWDRLVRGELDARWLAGRTARWTLAVAAGALALVLVVVLAEGLGQSPLALVAPLLKRRDRANLPLVQAILDAHFRLVLAGALTMVAAGAGAVLALARRRWLALFGVWAAVALVLWVEVFGVFQPALARNRTLAPFLAEVATRTGGAPLAFGPDTFDFAAAFYAPPQTRPYPLAPDEPLPSYVLVWERHLALLPAARTPEPLARSTGTDPSGRRRLVLVRLGASDEAALLPAP